MSTIAGELVTTTASTGTSINYAGQSQLVEDGKLDVAATGQTGDYHLEDRSRYRIQDTESIQSLWSNDAWTETGHTFSVDHEAHDVWIYNQTVNLPKNSEPIITNNPDGTTSSQIIQLGQDQAAITSVGGYDYHLTQSGTPKDFLFSLNHTSQSQSAKYDTGTWRAADGSSGANYDNLGTEAKNSRADLAGRVQNGTVYYTGIDVYQTKNTTTDNTGSGFALGSTTNSHTVGATQTIESRGGNSGSWYGSKLESGNSTTNYTTVSGTMGQPFSGMTQTGFNTTTLYGTAAQTGTSGAYGSLQTGETVTLEPVTLPPLPGGPNYQNAGGYSGSQPGIVGGFVTPISGKITFGDPSTIFPGMDPRNPFSCLYDPKAANHYQPTTDPAVTNRAIAVLGLLAATGEVGLGLKLVAGSIVSGGLSALPGAILIAHGGSRATHQWNQLWSGEIEPSFIEKKLGPEVDFGINLAADVVTVSMALKSTAQVGLRHLNHFAAESAAARTNAQLVQEIATRSEAWGVRQGLGNGPVAGTLKHGYADRLLTRYQSMFGDRGLSTEVRYLNGVEWQPGMPLRGSIHLDVVEGSLNNPTWVWDYKFGGAQLTPARINQIRTGAGLGPNVPVDAVRP